MEQQGRQYSRVRVVYKRSSTLTKVLVLFAVVLSTVALLGLRGLILEAEAQNAAALSQAAQLEEENTRLEEKIDSLGSLDSMMQIARDELGLEDPNTVILVPQG